MTELIKSVDRTIGRLLVNIIGLFGKDNSVKLKKKSKVLVIKYKVIGDSIYVLPLLKTLNKEFDAKIDILCDKSNSKVFEKHDFINKTLELSPKTVSSRIKHYDLVIDAEPWANLSAVVANLLGKKCLGFSHGARSKIYSKTIKYNKKQHIVQTYLDFFRLFSKKKPSDELVNLHFSKKAKNKVEKLLKKKTIGIAIGVSGNAKSRMWATDRWIKLIKRINSYMPSYEVVLLGTQDDKQLAESICKKTKARNLHGKTNIEEFFAIVDKCSAFVGCDSGPIHVAAAQKVPTIGLFGPNTPIIWAPYGKKNVSLFHKNPGVPTIDNTNPYFVKPTKAEKKAMDAISVDEVYNNLKKILA